MTNKRARPLNAFWPKVKRALLSSWIDVQGERHVLETSSERHAHPHPQVHMNREVYEYEQLYTRYEDWKKVS